MTVSLPVLSATWPASPVPPIASSATPAMAPAERWRDGPFMMFLLIVVLRPGRYGTP